MRLLVFVLLFVSCACNIQVSVNRINGNYNISIGDYRWLRSSRTALYADNHWYSSNDSSLPLIDTRIVQGYDSNLGSWNETQLIYSLNRGGIVSNVTGRIRQWNSQPAITFYLDTGDKPLINSDPLDKNQVRTIFPSFNIEQFTTNDNRGYFIFQGVMMGWATEHAGIWNSSSKVVTNSLEGGPIVLFDLIKKGQGDVIIISPFSQFMATSMNQENNALQYGVMGSIVTMPANYSHSLIVFYSSEGINKAMREWGRLMQQAYNRNDQYRLNDRTIKYLGYYTDGGAYYYYNTEAGLNYEETMLAIYRKIDLPFHYIQLDSWWYYKGIGLGVSQWTSRPDIFPDGLPSLYRQMESIPLAAHNRHWAPDTVYSDKYSFLIDNVDKMSLPVGTDSFWIDLLGEAAHDWGLIMYEQDWMHIQTSNFTPVTTDINLGRQWLMSMGEGADKANISIQYCSCFPRHALQALEIPQVTQARVSLDYSGHTIHNQSQWAIGISNLLSGALGIAPFKDVLWSSSNEPGSPYTPSAREPLPDREIAIAVLSTGPVAPGDAINYTDTKHIMKCCRQDGLILKPSQPITMIDLLISAWAQQNDGKPRETPGELYSTLSKIDGQFFYIIFASAMQRDYVIYPSSIGAQSGVIWSYDNPLVLETFDANHPLDISASNCNAASFCIWFISPVWQFDDVNATKYALLGESDKWTAVSQQRFTSIVTNTEKSQTIIVLEGSEAEIIQILVYHSAMNVLSVKCFLSAKSGQAQLIITPSNITCSGMDSAN